MKELDKILKVIRESVDYNSDYGDYDISEVTQDDHHRYETVAGITYELGSGENEILSVEEIEATPENTFYENQIEAYVKYLEDGGILESFPVQKYENKLTRWELYQKLEDNNDLYGWTWDIEKEYDLDFYELEEKLNEFDEIFDTNFTKEINNFDMSKYKVEDLDLGILGMEGEEEQIEELKNKVGELLEILDSIREAENEVEYTLTDMNHRFEAVKRMGIDRVWVEIV